MLSRDVEALVKRVLAGESGAWPALWLELQPVLERMVRRAGFLGRLSASEEDRQNVVYLVLDRLHEDGFRRLAAFLAARRDAPDLQFLPWLRVVAKRIAVDYVRQHDQYIDRRHIVGTGPGRWVEMAPLKPDSQGPGIRPPITNQATARQMLTYAARALSPEQQRAMVMWIAGTSFDEIALASGGRSARDGERLVRAGLERLRRHFKEE